MKFEDRITKKNQPLKMTPVEAMKKFGGQQGGQNFKNGRHDKNGVDRSIYTGCCDAARDARAVRGW